MIRRIIISLGVLAAVIGALVVGFSHAPKESVAAPAATKSLSALITAAMSDNDANDRNASSAPQQQVVNGWVARDLLHIIALQNAAAATTLDGIAAQAAPPPTDDRPVHLLMILALTLCWIGFWLAIPGAAKRAATDVDPSPDITRLPPSAPAAVTAQSESLIHSLAME